MMSKAIPLHLGESAIKHAPFICLDNNTQCIPQHYLRYQHTLASIEKLIQDIQFDAEYPIFVCEDKTGLYLQVGVIGYDNYLSYEDQAHYKIVYGRKWRIEPQLPSSEVIQTAFLGLKKAREHEIRELFRLSHSDKTSTPFNNHHDLPLLSHTLLNKTDECLDELNPLAIQSLLDRIQYDHGHFTLLNFEVRKLPHHEITHNEAAHFQYLIDLCFLKNAKSKLPELCPTPFTLILSEPNIHLLQHHLMQYLIQLSDRYLDENFLFRGVNRFSWLHNVDLIGQLSIQARDKQVSLKHPSLADEVRQNNYETDKTRAPQVNNSDFGMRLKERLEEFKGLEGILPINLAY